jgi:methyl-accepting chemotaxis protein
MRIRVKLLLGFAALIGINAATGWFAATGVGQVSAMTGELYDRTLMAGDFSRSALEQFLRQDRAIATVLSTKDRVVMINLPRMVGLLEQSVSDDLAIVEERFADRSGVDFVKQIRDMVGEYAALTNGLGAAILRGGDANQDRLDLTLARDALIERIDATFDLLVEATKEDGLVVRDDAALLGEATERMIALGVGAALVLGLLGALLLGGSITRPMARITSVLARLTADETDLEVPATGRRDEVGQMAKAVELFKNAERKRRAIET